MIIWIGSCKKYERLHEIIIDTFEFILLLAFLSNTGCRLQTIKSIFYPIIIKLDFVNYRFKIKI